MLHAAWLPVEVCTCEEVSKEALKGHKLSMQDMAELEAAVADYLLPVDAVGAPHRVLRAFRPLIFLGTPELAASLLVAALPPSIVLHHMYSRAPAALQSPAHPLRVHPGAGALPGPKGLCLHKLCECAHQSSQCLTGN